jgi:hypothetical protein
MSVVTNDTKKNVSTMMGVEPNVMYINYTLDNGQSPSVPIIEGTARNRHL